MKNIKISKGIKCLFVTLLYLIVYSNAFAQLGLRDSVEFQPRKGLPNFFSKIKNKEPIEVGFIGGSITQADGWRGKTLAWLKEYYQIDNISEHNIAIGGTDSKYGVFRIDNELLDKYDCDLVFVEFAVNDNSWVTDDIYKSMEGIVRKIWKKDPYTDICFVYTFHSGFFDEIEIGKMNLTASMHDTIASYYNIPAVFMGVEVYKSIQTGLVVWDDELTNIFTCQNESGQYVFTSDGVHPTKYGHQVYTDVISKSFKKIDTLNIESAHELISPLIEDNYENAKKLPVTVPNNHGFNEIDSFGELNYLDVYLDNTAKFLVSSDPSDYYSFSFKGKELGLNMMIGPTGGNYIVEIDGVKKEYKSFTGSCSMVLKYANYIKLSGDGEHKVKVYPSENILSLSEKREILSGESQKQDLDNNPNKYNKNELIFSDIFLTGEITNFYTDTANICRGDSVIWQNKTYKAAGEYYAIYQSLNGLDSIYQLNVNTYVQYYIEFKDTINYGDSLYWEGAYHKRTGDYIATYPSQSGCDSVLVLKLVVNNSPFLSEYLFEEPGGLTVLDSKGSNNGTLLSTVERVSGVRGNGLKLTGSGYVNLGKCFGDEVSDEVTLSAWIKPAGTSGSYQGVVLHGSASLDNYAIYINPDLKSIVFRTRNTEPFISQWSEVTAAVLWDGNWHQLTATYNGTQKVIYVDGVALKTINASGDIEHGSGYNLYIGAGRSLSSWDMYKGLIDEVMICNYGLTATEIPVPDLVRPVVTTFTIPTAFSDLVVPVTSFSATDNKAVTGYKLTESVAAPLSTDGDWQTVVPVSYTFTTEGTKTLYAWARDAAGNISLPLSSQVIISLAEVPDSVKPVVTAFTIPSESSTLVVSVTSFTATDNIIVAGYQLTESATAPLPADGNWQTVAPVSYTFTTEGTKMLYAWVKDAAGNVSEALSSQVVISIPVITDQVKPVVTAFSIPSESSILAVPVTNFTATDNTAVVGYKLTESVTAPLSADGDWQTVAPVSYTFTTEGIKTLYAWVKDAAGNVSDALSAQVIIRFPGSSSYSEYLFEEPGGLTVLDSKGSNDGTLINTVERVSGVRGNGLKLAGSGYVNLGKCFGEEVSDEVTLSAWIKPDGTSGSYQGVVLHGSASLDNYAIYINPDLKRVVFRTRNTVPSGSQWTEVSANILWDGNWHHVTATYNGTQKVIYVDGVALKTANASGNIEPGAGYNLYIGAGRSLTSWDMYKGLIDEVVICNYGLTAAEIPVPDLVRPVVTTFTTPTEASDLVVPVTSFVATDNKAVTGYKLTESVSAPLSTDGDWQTVAPVSYTFTTEGTKTLYAWARDAAGNISLPVSSQVIISLAEVPDSVKPVVTAFTIPSESSTLVVSVISFTATDNIIVAGYQLTESFTAPLPADGNWQTVAPVSYTFTTEGTKTLYAWVKDAAGNVSEALSSQVVISIPVITDQAKPVVTLFKLPSESSILEVPVTNFTATDNTAVVGYKLTESVTAPLPADGDWQTVAPASYTFTTEGIKTLYAWAKDAAGNVSDALSAQVIIRFPGSSLYSEYLFEEPGGLTVLDSKGSNHGTLINTVERVSGVRGNGLKLTGSGYVNLGKCFGEEVSDEVTLSAWIKPDKTSGSYQGVVLHGSASLDNYAIYINPDLKRVVFRTRNTVPSGSQWTEVSANILWDGNWHHVTATYNGTQKVIYVDGVALKTANASGNIEPGSGYNLYIGAGRSLSSWDMYKGLIDEVRIYSYGLTSNDIGEIFNEANQTTLKNMEIPEDIKVEASSESDFNSVISTEKIYLINSVTDLSQDFDFTMYPNPVNSFVNIDFGLIHGIESTIELIDQNGRVIQSEKSVNQSLIIELNNYSSGVYYLRIRNDKLQKTKKLIIKN